MALNLQARRWHTWVSVALALPILLVALTAVLMAHKRDLGTERIKVAASWWPGYQTKRPDDRVPDVRCILRTADGITWVGTGSGMVRIQGADTHGVDALRGLQVRAMTESRWGVLAASSGGLWAQQAGQWQRLLPGDILSVSTDGEDVAIVVKEQGILRSTDGRSWQKDTAALQALREPALRLQEPDLSLARLVKDLHTGEALLGKKAEWIWIDLVGLAMSLLALTGVTMWWRGEKRKAMASRNTLAGH